MLSMLKNVFKQTPKEYKRDPVKIKIQCNDFDSLQHTLSIDDQHLSNEYLSIKCPICFGDIKVSVFCIDKEYTHFENHAIKIQSGKLRPETVN